MSPSISRLIMNFAHTFQAVTISIQITIGSQLDYWWVSILCPCFKKKWVHFYEGWTSDKSLSNTVFLHTSDHFCWWFSRSTSTDQLELCIRQCWFHEEQDYLFDCDLRMRYLSCVGHLCALSRQERCRKSMTSFLCLYFLIFWYLQMGVTPLPDNQGVDQYFYQIIVFTGHRKDADTESKVRFII